MTKKLSTAKEQLGYYEFPIGNGQTKMMHFSWNFIRNLEVISGKSMTKWGEGMDKKTQEDQTEALVEVAFAALASYDQENSNEVDYNIYGVRNWMMDSLQDNPEVIPEMTKVFTESMGEKMGKMQGLAKAVKPQKK